MTSEILNIQSIPEVWLRLVGTEKVTIRKNGSNEITLTPVWDDEETEDEKARLEDIRQRRLAFKGSMKIWMADDFDEPLEEMREYME